MFKRFKGINELSIGVFLNYFYIVLVNLSAIVITPMLIKGMGKSNYDIFILAYSISLYFMLTDFGVGNVIIRYISKYRAQNTLEKQGPLLFNSSIAFGIIMLATGTVMMIFYSQLGLIFSKSLTNPALLQLMKKLFIIVLVNTLALFVQNFFFSILLGHEKFIFTRVINISRVAVRLLAITAIFYINMTAISVMLIDLIITLVTSCIIAFYAFYKLKVKIEFKLAAFESPLFKKLLSLFSFLYVAYIIDNLFFNINTLLMGSLQTSTEGVSIYYIALTFCNIAIQLSGTVVALSIPVITKSITTDTSKENLTRSIVPMGKIQTIVMTLFLIVFGVLGKEFIVLWLGWSFAQSHIIGLYILLGIYAFHSTSMGDTVLQAKNLHKYRLISSIASAVSAITFGFIFIKKYGITGAALGFLCAIFIGKVIVLNFFYIKAGINVLAYLKQTFIKIVIPSAITVAAVYGMNLVFSEPSIIGFLAKCAVTGIVYAITVFLLYLNGDERKLLLKRQMPFV